MVEIVRSTVGKNHERVASAMTSVEEMILVVEASRARRGSGQKWALAHSLGCFEGGRGHEWKGEGQGVVT